MWDERYSAEEYAYGKQPNDFLAEQVAQLSTLNGGRVLCLAEGEGRNAVFLAEQGFDVVAVDASAVGMQKAQRLADEKGVQITTIVSDLAAFEIPENSYDAVVSIFCHVPVSLRQSLHRAVVKGLRPGGKLLLEAYTPEQLNFKTGGPPLAELTMQLEDLRHELDGLEFEIAREIERDVVEGLYHTGRGAVVQLLASRSTQAPAC